MPDELVRTAPLGYYRLHGAPDLYRSPYPAEFLRRLVQEVGEVQEPLRDMYGHFNNDIDASVIGNARQLRTLVGQ